ncbi:MAG: M60 family metallopeptidase, partial [Clostridiales bacterium]|nr:M60 family metallopeptidase [Clostridiales bacterium]
DTIGLPDFLDSGMVGSFGWGITHEVGHTIDMPVRMLSETTNNVPTKYYDLMHGSKRGSFTTIRNSLTSDLVDTTDFWKGHTGFWEFWWDIESVIPGYWAKMENLYRYEPRQGVNEKTELLVYLSSLATGQDLCYYFERWGFSFNTANPFKYENASQNFKNAMQAAKNAGRINSDKQYKFWYVDDTVYNYVAVQKGASIYNLSFTPAIDSIVKVGGGYKIVFPKSNNNGHLGYEILQGNDRDGYKVIAFADGDSYIDTTSYPEGYAPSYKIVAYDKKLEHSSESSAVTVETTVSNPVCRVNGDNYGSLRDAMFAASAGSTIYLLADAWDVDIDIPFSVTIVIDQTVNGNITLTKGGDGAMFNLKKGATLTLQGETNRKIIVDGSLSQSGPIFNSEGGNISATNVKFTNCKSNSAGAVIVSNGGSLELVNCSFNNCTAPVGGAIYANGASVTITSCEFADCNAQDNGENLLGYNGGALYLVGCGVVTIKSSNFSACTATSSNGQVEQKNGGAIYAEGCKNIEIDSTTFSNCEATCGGAIYLTQSTVTLKNSCSITGCSAMDGGGIFIAEESTLTITRGTLTDNTATGNGGAVFVDATSSLSVNNLSTLSRNTATNYGGAIACEGTIKQIIGDENTSYLKRMLMEYNTAQYGGAIALIGGAQITTMQNVTLMNNNADYGAGMYIEGSAWLRENIMISRNTASQFGGGIYFKGGDSGTLNFNSNSTSVGSKPELYNDSAPIGYELYMESGNLQLLKVWFYFNYATAAKMPTEDEMKYSLYVNSGNVVIAGTATPSGGNRNLDAELTRDIFISQNATVHLTTAMFTIGPYIGPNPANMYQPFSYSDFHITLDSYDFDYVKVIFTADFEIPQDALTARDISFLNLDPSKGSIEIRGNTICYVPKQVKVTLDYGDEIGTESVMVENGSTYTFTADDFETKYPDKYIISFVVDGVTCHVGDSIAIDDMTVIQVVVGQKYKVTVSYGDNEEYIYVTPGEKFKFPSSSSAVDGNIIKWEYNDSYYDVGDEIDIDGDIVILPIKEGSLRVEFRVGDELLSVTYVDYAGTVTMPSLSEIEQGYELLGWYIDDTRYEVGETVSVTKDMTFVARIEKIKLTVV